MIHRESRQTYTHSTTDIAIQATDDTSSSDKEKEKEEEVYDFREPFLFSDMVLLVEDERLHCHRAILSLYSPVFKAMFQSRFEVAKPNFSDADAPSNSTPYETEVRHSSSVIQKCKLAMEIRHEIEPDVWILYYDPTTSSTGDEEVTAPEQETSSNQVSLPKDDAETVRELLRHLYTPGGCDMDSAAAQRLLPLIHRFQIDSLITTAERTMTFSMTDSLAPKMLALADMYQLNHLKQAAIDACTRLDMKRMAEALEETPLSAELKSTIFERRVLLLEKVITDIERSFSQSCIRMESKLERVFTNHCQIHSKPLSTTTVPVSIQLTNAPANDIDRLVIRPVEASAQDSASTNNVRLTTRVLQSNASDVDIPRSHELAEVAPGSSSAVTTALVEVPAVCESCVERISTHIKDLCRRALHKAQFVPYKPTVITSTSSA
ncbi:speckle-type poz protein [Echinococcus granulosus]|uniref:Speckle-type poz protein n=1 Tax=Echinococcus granulosus TaxID=6210 RepID=W6UW51_ECHGR|nr:speckle-type poz protein [Echinococcus granulosus]EUB57704.1 speckle-type poz protein [Echinococcus granulosus]